MTEFSIRIDRGNIYQDYSRDSAAENRTEQYGDKSGTPLKTSVEITSSKLLRGIKGVIFDFDGTLFDNALFPFYLILANPLDVIRLWKERLVRKRFAGVDFLSPEAYYQAFFSALGKICHRSPKRIQNWYFKRYMPRMAHVIKKHYQMRPGAEELFRYFNSPGALKVAIFSDYPLLKERLEALGVDSSQNIPIYGPDSFGAQKPAVRPFLRIAETLGIAPEETLVVGDREETDGLGAFNAGMRFFCLETGRKRYFRSDPYRRREKKPPHGPQLVMYAGAWEDLVKQLLKKKA
jgi:HAD superfamily hydrolase (TIGR01549 family)